MMSDEKGNPPMGVERPLTKADPMERRLADGLRFADMLGAANQQAIRENQDLVEALTELLVANGVIRLHELAERKRAVAKYFNERDQKPKVHLVVTEDNTSPITACR